jgi:hypothetical protein
MGPNHGKALLWSSQPVRSKACTRADETLHVTVLWGTNVLCVRELSPPRPFTLGTGGDCDLILPDGVGVSTRHALLEMDAEGVVVTLPGGERRRLVPGAPLEVEHASLRFRLELGARQTERFAGFAVDTSGLAYFGATLLSSAVVMGAMAWAMPAFGLLDDEAIERERRNDLLQYLNARAERELEADQGAEKSAGGEASAPSDAARGDSGEMGKPDAPRANRRFASSAPKADFDTTLTRSELVAEARTFGLIGILPTLAAVNPGSVWDVEGALDPRDRTAFGNLFGLDIGEAAGSGGLGLTGTGESGGGRGIGIGIGGIGTCQSEACGGSLGGMGRSSHLSAKGHGTAAPRLRSIGETSVSGHIPPEVVQRIVRQNFGRFRSCYESGLRKNPNLTGRITTRFVIDRNGAVSLARNGGSDLPDSGVVACVVAAFYGLSFPSPENGVVSVSYPIVFSVG